MRGARTGDHVLKIEVQISEQIALLRCAGRIVQGSETATLRKAAMMQDRPSILIDLFDVTGIDAGGLGLLVELDQWAEASHRTLMLLNPSPAVRQLLATTRLISVLPVSQNEAAAACHVA